MKKLFTGVAVLALIATVGAGSVLAMGGHHGGGWRNAANTGNGGAGYCYVDANGDGVCDNYGSGCGYNYVDANGDGVCDNYGTGVGGGHHGRCAR